MSGELPPWVECELCGDFYCTIHHMHAYECPAVDEWAGLGLTPYEPLPRGFTLPEDFVFKDD